MDLFIGRNLPTQQGSFSGCESWNLYSSIVQSYRDQGRDLTRDKFSFFEAANQGGCKIRIDVGKVRSRQLAIRIDSANNTSSATEQPPAGSKGFPISVHPDKGELLVGVEAPGEAMEDAPLVEAL